jgi:phosphatidylserine/phosphatidylglycerophosphate/cardiolipin synthase-like enzyme
MIELLKSPWTQTFEKLIAEAERSLILCAPYVARGPCDRVIAHVGTRSSSPFALAVITDLSRDNLISGATDAAAIARLVRSVPATTVHFLPSLHAKVYIADDRSAVVTSANLTDSGLSRNREYGILFEDCDMVHSVKQDILEYAALGSSIDLAFLDSVAAAAAELREMRQAAERTVRTTLRQEFEQRLRDADDEILRARIAGRTAHAIFSETILHLLRSGPMTTVQIHDGIRHIHPDLCDDAVDRVIDGRHFGKKWKHSVRTAQVYLRRRGDIALVDNRWQLT